MRLHSIKLSGFKSFAEPTHFMLPGQLVGVVGPNGCGKSNIMDAVRWVLGESKASELRGESMQDVIFNGSGQRKPAARASVELVFDNAEQRAGGQWSAFAEIALKRVLTREGTSSYFINNQLVRRRDVHNVFLGTGLGPRAYAIIGQGTISRIIESRPEDLRLFLEEAAGVSKYKERRRETAHRLADTRQNLSRVQDILHELGSQLEKLEQQAQLALRYRSLQSQATLRQQQIWFVKRQQAQADQAQAQRHIEQTNQELQARTQDMERVQHALEQARSVHQASSEQLNAAQGALYEATAEVGKMQAQMRLLDQSREQVQHRLGQLQEQTALWQARSQEAGAEIAQLTASIDPAQAQSLMLAEQSQAQAAALPCLEAALAKAQTQLEQQRHALGHVQQQMHAVGAQQRSIQEQIRQLGQRHERLGADSRALVGPTETALHYARAELLSAQAHKDSSDAALHSLQNSVPELERQRHDAQQELNAQSARHSSLSARLEAVQALQDKVSTNGKLSPWLLKHGLGGLPALWAQLQTEPGWENAVEAALRERLAALEVSRLELVQAFTHDAPQAKLTFYTRPAAAQTAPGDTASPPEVGLQPLLAYVHVPDLALKDLLAQWLHGCFVAANLPQALSLRAQLRPGQTLLVPQGHSVCAHSINFYAPDTEQAGLLQRAQEIEHLKKELRAQTLLLEQAQSALARAQSAYADASKRLGAARQSATDAHNRLHEQQIITLRLSQQAQQMQQRSAQIAADVAEVDAQLEALKERELSALAQFEELDEQLAQSQAQHSAQQDQVIHAEQALHHARQQQHHSERLAQEASFTLRSLQARQAELQRMLQTAAAQVQSLREQAQQACGELAQLEQASDPSSLQQALERKTQCEQTLATLRSQYDTLSIELRTLDEQRLQIEHRFAPLRQRANDYVIKEQAAHWGVQQYTELLAQADLGALEQSLVQEPLRVAQLQSQLERLEIDLAAMGAVNLAALDELGVARERQAFLEAQSSDLTQAIGTLEDAIKKIDSQTRELLSATFESVNSHFGRLFPELFGGGHARLTMTGEEILDAGMQVLAQPPGKKNQTIHLLSGGEKALTAIALVFAMFALNPAPFCLLDEVDAPLDDANTERYAQLVTKMSQQGTQFLFISHNKIAMEMAQQLIGVTMQEQGVSRIVAVDMQSAVSLLDSA